MKEILGRLKGKVDQAEVYHLRSKSVPVTFRAGRLESVKIQETQGLALRVIHGGRLGFGTSTDIKDPSALVASAVATSAYGDSAGFTFPGKRPAGGPAVHDRAVEKMTEKDLIGIGEEAIARLTKANPTLTANVNVTKVVETVSIANTSGLRVEEDRTRVSITLEVEHAREGDILVLAQDAQACYLEDFDPDAPVDRLIEFFRVGERIVASPSGRVPVVFTPNGTIALLVPLLSGVNGRAVYMGTSPLKGRIGEGVFDPRLTIDDDGTVPRATGSAAFDDEGTPSERTALVADGVLRSFVYDLRTAALAGVRSTGNGRKAGPFGNAGFRTPPNVGMTNVVVKEGTGEEKDLLRAVGDGLLVEGVLGLGQGNLAAGDFSNNVAAAFRIEKGELVGRVKNTMIAGNSYRLLKDNLIGLGGTARWAYGFMRVPPIAVGDVSVVTAES